MTEAEIATIIAKSLKRPTSEVIEFSQRDCGYTPDGFDPKLVKIEKFQKGSLYRPTIDEGYPKVTHSYLKALYSETNCHAPTAAPNLYLPVPADPTFMEKPSLYETVQFRKAVQVLETGEDLAPDQAMSLQAKAAIMNDQRVELLDDNTKGFLQGTAAALCVMQLREDSVLKQLPLLCRSLIEDTTHCQIVEDAIKFVCNIGPSCDAVLKPVRFFVLERGEEVTTILPGQVC